MEDNIRSEGFEKYEQMDAEDRLYEAQRKIKKMIFMRAAMAALLVWVVIRFPMPTGMRVFLGVVILVILATMLPAIKVLKTDLRDPDEE